MKKFLLSCALVTGAVFSYSQSFPINENFSNGLPTGWTAVASQVAVYNRNEGANCVSNSGLVTGPSIGSNGNNRTGFMTGPVANDPNTILVNVSFDAYAYKGNQLRCTDQLTSTQPCTAIGTVYLLPVNSNNVGDALAVSNNVAITINGSTSTSISVTAATPIVGDFKVLVDISYVDCDVNGSVRFVIDNVRITAAAGAPLPVNLKSFDARRDRSNVVINWQTATEINNTGFYVQRFNDGKWESVAFVPSKDPNSTSLVSYSFSDLNNSRSVTQYRLLQVDLDGKAKLSYIVSVRGLDQLGKNMVYPNPSSDGAVNVLFIDVTGLRDVIVSDMSGRIVKQLTNISTGSVRIDNLMTGFYNIRIINKATGDQAIEKVVINKR